MCAGRVRVSTKSSTYLKPNLPWIYSVLPQLHNLGGRKAFSPTIVITYTCTRKWYIMSSCVVVHMSSLCTPKSVTVTITITIPSGKLLGYREGDGPYKWIRWSDADRKIKEFRRGLVQLGLTGKLQLLMLTSPAV